MKATLTSKGQITIPAKIRRKLGLRSGQVLDFDEDSPFLKAVLVFDEDAMRSVLGCAEDKLAKATMFAVQLGSHFDKRVKAVYSRSAVDTLITIKDQPPLYDRPGNRCRRQQDRLSPR